MKVTVLDAMLNFQFFKKKKQQQIKLVVLIVQNIIEGDEIRPQKTPHVKGTSFNDPIQTIEPTQRIAPT
jgi:hypothetical protein